MIEPPGPPLPPSGPPSGLNFSRCTEATPLPPRPALTTSVTRSTKVGTAIGAPFFLRWFEVRACEPRNQTKGVPDGQGRPSLNAWVRSGVRSLRRDDVDHATTTAGAELDVA